MSRWKTTARSAKGSCASVRGLEYRPCFHSTKLATRKREHFLLEVLSTASRCYSILVALKLSCVQPLTISLIADGPHHYHPACGHKGSSHLSPVHALQFLSRCKFSTLTTRQSMVEFYWNLVTRESAKNIVVELLIAIFIHTYFQWTLLVFPGWSSTILASPRRHDRFLEETQEDAGVTTTKSFTLKSGDELVVMLGKERFHAPEILFTVGEWSRNCFADDSL